MKKQIIFTNLLLALVCGLISSTAAAAQVKMWGANFSGQIGDGTTTDRPLPTTISSLNDVIAIQGGNAHSLAVKANGTVLAWGSNASGQLGNGTTNTDFGSCQCNPTPGTVSGLTNVVAVSAGLSSLALKADGTVWAWGDNSYGQIGDGTRTRRLTPVQVGFGVSGFNNIIAIDAGLHHNLALKSDGTVWAWGDNSYGQIGDGTINTDRLSPVQIASLSNNILAVSAGIFHSLALSKTGQVYTWGYNNYGEIGNGTTGGNALTPTLNTNISGVAQIQAGQWRSVALKTDGTVWAWGYNNNGQVGNGATTTTGCLCISTPTQTTISGITAIRAGNGNHTLARRITGFVRAWGDNHRGQIGNGTTTVNGLPTPMQSAVGSGNVIFGTGDYHSLLSDPTIPTPAGINVRTRFGDGYVHSNSVSLAGNTTITAIDSTATGLTPPAGLSITTNNQAYRILTTASITFGSDTFICINATNEFDQTEFNKLHILQGDSGTLIDQTYSKNYQRREICAKIQLLGNSYLNSFRLAKEIAPTAAQISVSGRVLNQSGRAVSKARVTIVSTDGAQQSVLTNPFGYYSLGGIDSGSFVIVSVSAKGYTFESSQIGMQAMEDLTEINFTGTQSNPERR